MKPTGTMIYDKQTLDKCSLEKLEHFEKEHQEEITKLLKEWFEIDKTDFSYVNKITDKDWHVQAASHRLTNIQTAINLKMNA